jgi:hypothetical protein
MRYASLITAGVAAALGLSATTASAVQVLFSEGNHGEIITNKFLAQYGFNVSAVNVGGGPNKAMIFDSRKRGTLDPDLEGPDQFTGTGPSWGNGNIPDRQDLGKLLVLAENDVDANGNGFVDNPSDEGSRPAGRIILDFLQPITSLGFNLVDIEGPTEFNNDAGYVMTFQGLLPSGRGGSSRVGFGDFIQPGDPFFDPTVIKPITAAQLGMTSFNRVIFDLGGSGAIDDLRYTFIPEPASMALMLPALAMLRRRRA